MSCVSLPFSFNLISVSKLTHTLNCSLLINADKCFLKDLATSKMIGMAELQDGLYKLVTPNPIPTCFSVQTYVALWHFRLGHSSVSRMQLLNKHIPNLNSSFQQYTTCPIAKQKCLPFPIGHHKCVAPFDLVHCDIWGPMAISTPDGFRYFLSIVDDFSRATWIYLMKSKFEVGPLLQSFFSHIET